MGSESPKSSFSERQNSTFSEQGHVANQLKENHEMQQHGYKYFARRRLPPQTLGMGSLGQNPTFSEYGHVTYQIKENHEYSNMVANIYSADTRNPGDRVNSSNSTFQNMVMLRIKLKKITNAAIWLQLLYPQTPPPHDPRDLGVYMSKFNLFRTRSCCIQIKQNHEGSNMVANVLSADTPEDGVNRSKFNRFRTWSCCISN